MIEFKLLTRDPNKKNFPRQATALLDLHEGKYSVRELHGWRENLQLPFFFSGDTQFTVVQGPDHYAQLLINGEVKNGIAFLAGRGVKFTGLEHMGILTVTRRRSVAFLEEDRPYSQPHTGVQIGTRRLNIRCLI